MDQLQSKDAHDCARIGRIVRPDEVHAHLAEHGIAVFQGLQGAQHLIELGQTLGAVLPHPDSDEHGVTVITERNSPRIGALTAGFTRAAVAAHTDRADLPVPPPLLLTLCTVQATMGGESIFVDGAAVHRVLAVQAPDALRALNQPGAVSYGRTHVYTGPVFEPTSHGRRVRLRLWPRDAGRFSPEAESALEPLQQAISAQTFTMRLKAGQGYVIDNHRWLHGRRPFTGDRVMLRIGVHPHPTMQLETGIANFPHQREGRG
ncbi:TauD/TfdA family dioxygenase [Streptomyces nodosus]